MTQPPQVFVFDVIETLVSLEPLQARMSDAGLPEGALRLFFAQMLRDAFALETAGTFLPFKQIASAGLAVTMANAGLPPDPKRVEAILSSFAELPVHDDVRPAFERVRAAGARILTLTNGSADTTRAVLARAGVAELIEQVLSIDDVGHWKPHREVYLSAARNAAAPSDRVALVAAHAWDTHGAKQAGLRTGWVARLDRIYPATMAAPDAQGRDLIEVVDALLAADG